MTDAHEEPLVPARIINEHVYCPRLAWLEWEARAFVDNLETAEGTDAHRRTDVARGRLGDPDAPGDARVITALALSSERLGVTAKLDRVELRDGVAIPVETKRGRPRTRAAQPVWDPELAQITAQVLLLREAGFETSHAEVYFAESRTRHEVTIPPEAEAWIARLVSEVRAAAAVWTPPAPLVDSPKCPRCSLVGVCLPDETNRLRGAAPAGSAPRRLVARDDPRTPLYVMTPGATVRKASGRLELVKDRETIASRRLLDIAHLAVFGNVTVSSAAMRACLEQDTPVLWFSSGGWFTGAAVPHGGSWVARRIAQVGLAGEAAAIALARRFVAGKVKNQRTLLRRWATRARRPCSPHSRRSRAMQSKRSTRRPCSASRAQPPGSTSATSAACSPSSGTSSRSPGRNRRPPSDPVNALLSFAYALLVRDATVACHAAGLDPQVGFLHRPRFGRPSLALDLAEEFRPLVGDSTVVTAINNGEMRAHDFVRRGGAVALTDAGRRRVIAAYERRVRVMLAHPVFGYRVSYRRAIELQARQLAAVIDGQLPEYVPLTTR